MSNTNPATSRYRHPITGCRPAQLYGPWAMRQSDFDQLLQMAKTFDLEQAVKDKQADDSAEEDMGYKLHDGVAVISLDGAMSKQPTSFDVGASTVQVRRAIRNAVEDDVCKSIMLLIDSPGGTVSGTDSLGSDIAWANEHKPVVAHVEDLCCSAAMWAASQCRKITSGPTACVGSIGTYMVVYDQSKAYEQAGVKAIRVDSGGVKGAGVEGCPVTPEQLKAWQAEIDDITGLFIQAVATGRGMSVKSVKELATGNVWIGQKAVDAGLVDKICQLDDAMDECRKMGEREAKGKELVPAGSNGETIVTIPDRALQVKSFNIISIPENIFKKKIGNIVEGPMGFHMPEFTARSIESAMKSLPKSKEFEYKRKSIPLESFESRENREEVSYITTDACDREGEIMLPGGMDDSKYNGTVTWCHAWGPVDGYCGLPVGQSLWRKSKAHGVAAATRYHNRPAGWVGDWLPDAIVSMQAGRPPSLTGKSIGFLPMSVRTATSAEKRANPQWADAIIFDSWHLLEYAVCPIQCNPECEITEDETAKSSSLVETAFKSFKNYFVSTGRIGASEVAAKLGQVEAVVTKAVANVGDDGWPDEPVEPSEIQEIVVAVLTAEQHRKALLADLKLKPSDLKNISHQVNEAVLDAWFKITGRV